MSEYPKTSSFLWFHGNAEAAAEFYVSLLPNSEITHVERRHGGEADGEAFIVSFTLCGNDYTAMNGGPRYTLNEAFSISIVCDGQPEVDRLWAALSEGGRTMACGWLQDRFGVTWQIVPRQFGELMKSGTPEQSGRVMQAMMNQVKFDVAALQAAFDGGAA